ncbi:MAG: phosphotransferase [Acidimicrobiales bacterium]
MTHPGTHLDAKPVLQDLLDGADSREAWQPDDSKSGARFEHVVIAGDRYVLKYQDPRQDWLLRATGDPGMRYVLLWEHGLFDRLPDVVDPAVVAAAFDGTVGMVLLRDVTEQLLTPGEPFSMEQHNRFLDHMAAMHASFWNWHDEVGLTPIATRYLIFSPRVADAEAAAGSIAGVPAAMAEGWARLPGVSPSLAKIVMPLLDDLDPLLSALQEVPHTLVHGDWKAANIGSDTDGRTVLLDFGEASGEASPIADLSWYLALNSDLLPESKDAAIATYRAALEGHGIDTAGWWDRAVALELLGTMVQFGWEKVLGGPGPELAWWEKWATAGAKCL